MSVFDGDRALVLAREEIARRVGLGDVWDQLLTEDDTPTRQLLISVVSTLALYMDETGTHIAPAA